MSTIKTVQVTGSKLKAGQIVCLSGKHYYRVGTPPTKNVAGVCNLIKGISASIQKSVRLNAETIYAVADVKDVNELKRRTGAKPSITKGAVTTANALGSAQAEATTGIPAGGSNPTANPVNPELPVDPTIPPAGSGTETGTTPDSTDPVPPQKPTEGHEEPVDSVKNLQNEPTALDKLKAAQTANAANATKTSE